jgi:hypothetical protein
MAPTGVSAALSTSHIGDSEDSRSRSCEPVSRIGLVDGVRGTLMIESANGSQLELSNWRLVDGGECTALAHITMANSTDWQVPGITANKAEVRFRRNAEVAVGEPFGILLFSSERDRWVWLNLGRVARIGVCTA